MKSILQNFYKRVIIITCAFTETQRQAVEWEHFLVGKTRWGGAVRNTLTGDILNTEKLQVR